MRCPQCNCDEDKVIDTRVIREGESIRRRRQCLHCGHRFTTYEFIVRSEKQVIKHDGHREDFDPEKLRTGIRRACWKRPVSAAVVDQAVQKISNWVENLPEREVSSAAIGEQVMDVLRTVDEVAYVRFASVYRRFKDADDFMETIKNLPGRDSPQPPDKPRKRTQNAPTPPPRNTQ